MQTSAWVRRSCSDPVWVIHAICKDSTLSRGSVVGCSRGARYSLLPPPALLRSGCWAASRWWEASRPATFAKSRGVYPYHPLNEVTLFSSERIEEKRRRAHHARSPRLRRQRFMPQGCFPGDLLRICQADAHRCDHVRLARRFFDDSLCHGLGPQDRMSSTVAFTALRPPRLSLSAHAT
jgi:hypothetical protein